MLTAIAGELLDYGLLSGLEAQSEISELLDELYYEGLSAPNITVQRSASR